MGNLDFDAEGVDTSSDPFEILPDGTEVLAEVSKSEIKETNAGTGHYLALQFDSVDDETAKGRSFWTNLNIDNPNEKAVKIANRELALLVKACGKARVSDHEELRGIPVCIVLGVEPARGEYEARNKIKSYKPASEKGVKPARKGAQAAQPAKNGTAEQKSEPPKQAPWAR